MKPVRLPQLLQSAISILEFPKRSLGFGTLFMVVITLGAWLLVIQRKSFDRRYD